MFNRPPNAQLSEEEQKKKAGQELLNKWIQNAQASLKEDVKDIFVPSRRSK
jgi:hypothetical protein